jgi:hypothetical protein
VLNVLAFLAGFSPYKTIAAVVAAIGLLVSVYFIGRSDGADSVRAKWDAERIELVEAQAITLADAIKKSETLQQQKTRAEETYAKALADRDRRISDLAATSLRDAAITRAAGSGDDSLAACRADAAVLRDVLAGVDGEAGRLAAAADRHADEVRVLLEAWPR